MSKGNPIFEAQFATLVEKFPGATARQLASGGYDVRIPDMPVRGDFDRETVEVRFLAPPGFPAACPQNFWAYPDLLLKNGSRPHHTVGGIARWLAPNPDDEDFGALGMGRSNSMAGSPGYHGLWFSIRPQSWWPVRDSLLTYVRFIEQRLTDDRAYTEAP